MDGHGSPLSLKTQVKSQQQNRLLIQILGIFPKRRNMAMLSPRQKHSVVTYIGDTVNMLASSPLQGAPLGDRIRKTIQHAPDLFADPQNTAVVAKRSENSLGNLVVSRAGSPTPPAARGEIWGAGEGDQTCSAPRTVSSNRAGRHKPWRRPGRPGHPEPVWFGHHSWHLPPAGPRLPDQSVGWHSPT